VLLSVEPSVKELTKKDYENRMGIGPKGPASKKAKDVGQSVGQDSKAKDDAPVLLSRAEAIKKLRTKGHEYKDLQRKTKGELNALL